MSNTPIILWLRRDLRLADHPAMSEAAKSGRPVIPVFIYDEVFETYGACPKWRQGLAVAQFGEALAGIGSKLVLRRGDALQVLQALIDETGAGAVYWSRAYDPAAIARDTGVKAALKDAGVEAQSFAGHLLFEPWTVQTKTSGAYFKVFTPMWKSVRGRDLAAALPAVSALAAPEAWPASDALDDWRMGAAMRRGADVVGKYVVVGERAALDRLGAFIEDKIDGYQAARDVMAMEGTSGLSENLTYGEISPLTCWHAGWAALNAGKSGAETFLKELVWREFAYQLAFHTPHIVDGNWKPEWDGFPWNEDVTAEVVAWQRGRTGVQLVDAAMREMYVTGYMHNRGRMIVASYLTKHLMTHWKLGQAWFDDCLIDWDPASNAMGWQWTAGSGPDASPYFRVFNPDTQAEKFDKSRNYRARYLGELFATHDARAEEYYDAVPLSWGLSIKDAYPKPVVGLSEGRERALAAYKDR